MSSVTLYRASGLALLLGPVLFIIGLTLALVFQTGTPLEFNMTGVWTSGLALLLIVGVVVFGISLVISIFGLGALASVLSWVSGVLGLLGLAWMGYVLWTTKGEAVPQPALAP